MFFFGAALFHYILANSINSQSHSVLKELHRFSKALLHGFIWNDNSTAAKAIFERIDEQFTAVEQSLTNETETLLEQFKIARPLMAGAKSGHFVSGESANRLIESLKYISDQFLERTQILGDEGLDWQDPKVKDIRAIYLDASFLRAMVKGVIDSSKQRLFSDEDRNVIKDKLVALNRHNDELFSENLYSKLDPQLNLISQNLVEIIRSFEDERMSLGKAQEEFSKLVSTIDSD